MNKVVEENKVAVVESCTDKVAPGEILVADFDQQKNNPCEWTIWRCLCCRAGCVSVLFYKIYSLTGQILDFENSSCTRPFAVELIKSLASASEPF